MKRYPIAATKWLAALVVFAAESVHAQARGPSVQDIRGKSPPVSESPEIRAQKLAELDAWLRRLPGRFRIRIDQGLAPQSMCILAGPGGSCTGYQTMEAPTQATREGLGECRGIGAGSGVHCRFYVVATTNPYFAGGPDANVRDVQHTEILFGLDPDGPVMRSMWAIWYSQESMSLGSFDYGMSCWAAGALSGDAVKITDATGRGCDSMDLIRATRDGELIKISSSRGGGNAVIELRRQKPDDAAE